MIKKVSVLVILFGFITVGIVNSMENEELDQLPGLSIGEKAPEFVLKSLEGKTVRLSDYRGKKVILNFWATWCPPCKMEMPHMQAFSDEVGDKVVILAVNIDPEYDVNGFVKKIGIRFPILLDEKDEVNSLYQILTIPTTFFIDEEGIIRYKYLSAMPIEIIREHINNM